jgi:outer membrane autotransporter protein
LLLADLSFQWYPTGNNFYLFAGPGFSRIDLEVDVPGDDNDIKEDNTSFTINGGLGYRWDIGNFFIRPQVMARWFDEQDFEADEIASYDGLDTQYSIGLGWRF